MNAQREPDPLPPLIKARLRTHCADDSLILRLLAPPAEFPAHIYTPDRTMPLCAGEDCIFCIHGIAPGTARLVPVAYLRSVREEAVWVPAIWKPGLQAIEATGDFAPGRVVRIRRVSKRRVEVTTVPELEAWPAPASPTLDLEAAYRAAVPHPRSLNIPVGFSYRPGMRTLTSGLYTAVHALSHAPPQELVCLAGETLPQCNRCGPGVAYRLDRAVPYLGKHPLYADLESGPPEDPDD